MNNAKKIPLISAILMSINIMIGGGVLLGPAKMAAVAGNWSFIGWIIVATIYLPQVLSIARMAEIFPNSGGFFSYCKSGLGNFVGHLGGWIYFVGYSSAAATILSAYRTYLMKQFPSTSFFESSPLFFITAITVLIALNNMKISTLASFQSTLTLIKISPVIIAIALLPFFLKTDLSFPAEQLSSLPWSLPFAIFGFLGFEFAASLVNDIEGGAAQAQKAIVVGFLFVTIIYTAFHYSLLNIMGAEGLTTHLAAGFPLFVAEQFAMLGKILTLGVSTATIITYFNSSNGLITLGSSILNGMGKSGKIWGGTILSYNTTNNRPFYAIALSGMLTTLLGVLTKSTDILGAGTNFLVTLTFIIANTSLLVADKEASVCMRIINLIAIPISLGLACFHFTMIGVDMSTRLTNIAPFIALIFAGLLLYRPLLKNK